ncbi:AAA family ATPase [Bacteroides ovatus]|jgi:hypothetical protein|uniref:AAA family ATPase n=1 Tax=Bacteroides ovatus TaxID=28116 RepID=UPI0018A09C73|nr:ATP-binding protein [Bacteroides ovatus]
MFLIEDFSFENFKSFKDMQSLRMGAANIRTNKEEFEENNVIVTGGGNRLLKSKVVYGANASGKSNVLKALFTFCDIIQYCLSEENKGMDFMDHFLFSTETTKKPSYFQLIFYMDDIKYRYGFEIDEKVVHNEWLYVTRHRETPIFTREGQNVTVAKSLMEMGYDIAKMKTKLFNERVLFLSVADSFSDKLASRIVEEIKQFSKVNSKISLEEKKTNFLKDKLLKDKIVKLLKYADVGIEDIDQIILGDEKIDATSNFLLGVHRKYDKNLNKIGESVTLFDSMESEGTKEMLGISLPIITALEIGTPIVIDEFGAKLHPLLTRKILSLFNSKENTRSQLIVATHTTELMDPRLLRRDQIDFVEKDKYGRSYLYTLVEIKGIRSEKYEQDYLEGKYGAVPFLGNWDNLCDIINDIENEEED